MAKPYRIFLRFKPAEVPGIPQARHMTLSCCFFSEDLGRHFNDESDWIHVPANIDVSDSGAKAWMVLDLNAKETREEGDRVPIRVFRVVYDSEVPTFKLTSYNEVRRFSKMLEWGEPER
ncbi:hypothetical protein BJY00DRAFT_312948 [Aspergillus carlsbadensis]|nr:hypothetical protein BJY00DRAFT_312948 [Aspergillus carlsbadensis]